MRFCSKSQKTVCDMFKQIQICVKDSSQANAGDFVMKKVVKAQPKYWKELNVISHIVERLC